VRPMPDDRLDHLAWSRGLGEAYHDYRGELKFFSRETRRAILAAMGCDVRDAPAIEREIAAIERYRWRAGVPGITVLRPDERRVPIVVALDAANRELHWTLTLADGGSLSGEAVPETLHETERRELDGRWYTRRLLELPELPAGDHRLSVSMTALSLADGAIVMAPGHAYEPPAIAAGARLWGVAVQLYTLRSRTNWGIGDFADLRTVIRHAAAHGAAFVGLNPLHALFAANPGHFSPYSPSSRRFLNVLYIAVPEVEEFASCPAARELVASPAGAERLRELQQTDRVDYRGVAALKLEALELLWHAFVARQLRDATPRAREFQSYRIERGEALEVHALHEAIDAHMRTADPACWGWPAWPEELRDPRGPGARGFAESHATDVGFHAWLQWLAEVQLREARVFARELGMAVGLYGDYAVGVNPAGSETWSEQRVYRLDAAVGAPPDALALKGQDWGVPPQDPLALASDAYRPFRALIAANLRHFGALRIDHVMALFRQWWVPRGFSSTQGGYVHYPLDDLMSVLALESGHHECLVVGEDLGTVPDEVRSALGRYGIYRYKVLLFEKQHDGRFRAPHDYERRSVASVTTHDLPTLRGYWEGRDLEIRDALALYPNDEIRRLVHEERDRDRSALLAALHDAALDPATAAPDRPYSEPLAIAVQEFLASSRSALAVVQIEDLIATRDPVNVPGTSDEYPNWQRKLGANIDELFERESVARVLSAVARARGR
jgi:4-alpha-glucanotransferase